MRRAGYQSQLFVVKAMIFEEVMLPNSKVWRSRLTRSESDRELGLGTRSTAPECGSTKTMSFTDITEYGHVCLPPAQGFEDNLGDIENSEVASRARRLWRNGPERQARTASSVDLAKIDAL